MGSNGCSEGTKGHQGHQSHQGYLRNQSDEKQRRKSDNKRWIEIDNGEKRLKTMKNNENMMNKDENQLIKMKKRDEKQWKAMKNNENYEKHLVILKGLQWKSWSDDRQTRHTQSITTYRLDQSIGWAE